jgi:hypothetical protein
MAHLLPLIDVFRSVVDTYSVFDTDVVLASYFADSPGFMANEQSYQLQVGFALGMRIDMLIDRLIRCLHAWILGMFQL